MRIGILEYQGYHLQYRDTLVRICGDHDVILYDDPYVAVNESDTLDLLFINTIRPLPSEYLMWKSLNPKCKTILTIHEVNTDFTFMKGIIKKFDSISVPHVSMYRYIRDKKLYNGKIHIFPFLVHEIKHNNRSNLIVVPGKIEKFRRDYDLMFKIIRKDEKWCILGEPIGRYGINLLRKAQKYIDNGYNILFFRNRIPDSMYNLILKECACIFSPLRNPTIGHNRLRHEYYGKTKVCGAMFESVKYGKPYLSSIKDFTIDYNDYLLSDWKKYLNEVVI